MVHVWYHHVNNITRYPTPHYSLDLYAKLQDDPTLRLNVRYRILGLPAGCLMQERAWLKTLIDFGDPREYIDEINPAFRRLQRWFKAQARERKELRGKVLAFMMASHARLGSESALSQLDPDLLCRIGQSTICTRQPCF